jgi:hypothetical protein
MCHATHLLMLLLPLLLVLLELLVPLLLLLLPSRLGKATATDDTASIMAGECKEQYACVRSEEE